MVVGQVNMYNISVQNIKVDLKGFLEPVVFSISNIEGLGGFVSEDCKIPIFFVFLKPSLNPIWGGGGWKDKHQQLIFKAIF